MKIYLPLALGFALCCGPACKEESQSDNAQPAGSQKDESNTKATSSQKSLQQQNKPAPIKKTDPYKTTPYKEVHQIDKLAAHPSDPNRMSKGVAMEQIIPRPAIATGEQAIKDYPATPRFHYQLGRAYSAGGQKQKAILCFEKAAEMGYGMAFYNLGTAYGNGDGVTRNPKKSEHYLKKAITQGIEIAKAQLQYFVFNPEGFSNPKYFEALYKGEVAKLRVNRSEMATQMAYFTSPFMKSKELRPPISQSAAMKLAQHASANVMGGLLGDLVRSRNRNPSRGREDAAIKGYQEGQQMSLKLMMRESTGRKDAQLFFDRYGVDSPVAKQLFKNIETYANNLGNASFWKEAEKKAYGR